MKNRVYYFIFNASMIFLLASVSTECRQKNRSEDSHLDSPSARLDSANRVNESIAMYKNCDEKIVKSKFLEWMDLYYPDWPIKGKIKVFEVPQEINSVFGKPCPYNIRFQTVNPHMKEFGDKEIIIVRFDWNDTRFESYSIEPVRGNLY